MSLEDANKRFQFHRARNEKFKAAYAKYREAQRDWENFIQDDAYRYCAYRVMVDFPDRQDIANALDPDYEE